MDMQFKDPSNLNSLCCGLPLQDDPNGSNLGGNLYYGDPMSFSPTIIDYMIKRFCVKSVIDVGSGRGHLPWYLTQNYDVSVIGMDGLMSNIKDSLYPLVHCDLTKGSFQASEVDLVTCIEVVEHIDEKYMDNLLDTLALGKVILMTHAFPGNSSSEYHVNEQSDQYWVEKLASRNYAVMMKDTIIVRSLERREAHAPKYFAESALVFGRVPQGISFKS